MRKLIAGQNGESGAGLVEYAIVVALIAVVGVVGVQILGSSVAESYSASGAAIERGGTVEASKTATYKDQISAKFEVVSGRVYLGTVKADGWTSKVTRDTGRRISMKFTNTESGDVVRVNGWLNRRDKLRSSVRKRR